MNQITGVGYSSDVTKQAVAAAMTLIRSKKKTIFWAGIELQRYALTKPFLKLLDSVNK